MPYVLKCLPQSAWLLSKLATHMRRYAGCLMVSSLSLADFDMAVT